MTYLGADYALVDTTNQGSEKMLVLTRKPQEKIQIGDNITITVIKTKGKTVRLGIEAPANVNVLRGELTFEIENNEVSPEQEVDKVRSSTTRNRIEKALETHGQAGSDSQEPSDSKTQFVRASRSKIKTLLPELLGDAGPLREMLDRRVEIS